MRRATFGGLLACLAAPAALWAQACGTSRATGGSAGTGAGSTTTVPTGGSTASSGTTGTGAATSASSGSTGSSSSSGAVVGDSVLMHHKSPSHDGVYVQPKLSKAAISTLHKDPTFSPPAIQGKVYVQPLFIDGGPGGQDLVIIATEDAIVYALDGATGAQVWKTTLGVPVPAAMRPCGNITPNIGVTGTPVVDFPSRTMFVDSEVIPTGGTPTHQVFALSVDTGAVQPGWPVDMQVVAQVGGTKFQSAAQGQRGALALLGGTLYVPFGGRAGDCGSYHGWVVAISIASPANVQAWATSAFAGGAWLPNGIATDGESLFVSTGNTIAANGTWGGGDAVISLTPAPLGMSGFFAPKNWPVLDAQDLDMGTGPVPFDLPGSTPGKLVVTFGKDGNAYLLDRTNLGGESAAIGGKAAMCTKTDTTNACASLHAASGEIISAPAVYTTATATYVVTRGKGAACTAGAGGDVLALQVVPGSPPALAPSWCGGINGNGSPTVTTTDGHADAIVWALGSGGAGSNQLRAFDGDTGAPITFADSNLMIPNMQSYTPPIAAKGRIFVAADGPVGVVAFTL